jgi:hypothetical protein
MRVARTTTKGAAGPGRKAGRGGADGFRPAGRAEGGGAVAGTGVLGSIDALAALQGIDGADGADGAAAAAAQGAAMLDDLDALRDGLLAGELDDATLARLRDRLGARRRGRLDRGLEAVLDDIELRAAVELAKREPAAAATSAPEPAPDATAPADAAARARKAYGGIPPAG